MITAHTTGHAVLGHRREEEAKHGECAVVRVDPDGSNVTGVPVDEAVYHKLPTNETWTRSSVSWGMRCEA